MALSLTRYPLPNAEVLGCCVPPMYPGLTDADFVALRRYKRGHADQIAAHDEMADVVARLQWTRWLFLTARLT